ncbi:hypothetical protein, partial [Aestuariivirga sp.]|uniref:hypothetical protein n=1 Tax=Aestuariivirga sp. TaxID=2650926 RepID=UPI00301A5920
RFPGSTPTIIASSEQHHSKEAPYFGAFLHFGSFTPPVNEGGTLGWKPRLRVPVSTPQGSTQVSTSRVPPNEVSMIPESYGTLASQDPLLTAPPPRSGMNQKRLHRAAWH